MTANLLLIIPARGGSKRLPGKNLARIGGRTLIAHTADFLTAEGLMASAILSTDDPEIAAEGRRVGLQVPFMRPAQLATDSATTLDVVLHGLEQTMADRARPPDFVGILQVTSPLRPPGLVRKALAALERTPTANSIVAMKRLHVPANFVFTTGSDGTGVPVSSSTAPALVPTGALYITRTPALRAQASIYAKPVLPLEVSTRASIDIDTADDLALAAALLAQSQGDARAN